MHEIFTLRSVLQQLINYIEKRPVLAITGITSIILLPNLGLLQVSIMEARNFISAREILSDGNFLIPTLNGEFRFSKPPLPTWITAFFALIFGLENLWGLRLPGAIMVMVLGVGVYTLSRKLTHSKKMGLLSGLITVTSLYVLLIIYEAPWDIYTHAFGLWSIVFLERGLISVVKRRKYIAIGSLFLGLAILSKGPVVFYSLLLPFLIAYIILYRSQIGRKSIFQVALWLFGGIIIGASWYLYALFVQSSEFQNDVTREVSNWNSYNKRPFYYYWNFFLQSGVWMIPSLLSVVFCYFKKHVAQKRVYMLVIIWLFVGLVLLSIVPEKKIRYLMPLLIPLAISTGIYMDMLRLRFKETKLWERLPVYIHYGVIAVVGILSIGVGFVLGWNVRVLLGGSILCSLGILLLRLLRSDQVEKLFYVSILFFCLTPLFFGKSLVQSVGNTAYADFEMISLDAIPMYGYEVEMPEMIWDYGNKIPKVTQDMLASKSITAPFYLLQSFSGKNTLDTDSSYYRFQLVDTVDLNKPASNNMNYKSRKKALIYLVKDKK